MVMASFGAMLGATDTRPCDSPSRLSEFHVFFYVKMDPGRLFVRSPRILRSLVRSLPRLRSTRNFDALGIFFRRRV